MNNPSESVVETSSPSSPQQRPAKQRRSVEQKRAIVEESLRPGASVSVVARTHGVNANQIHQWRKLYHAGRLGAGTAQLLPVTVTDAVARPAAGYRSRVSPSGCIRIQLPQAEIRVEGSADPISLRVVLECLRA